MIDAAVTRLDCGSMSMGFSGVHASLPTGRETSASCPFRPPQGEEGSVGIGAGKLTRIPPPGVSVRCTIQFSAVYFDVSANISIGRDGENFKEIRRYTWTICTALRIAISKGYRTDGD